MRAVRSGVSVAPIVACSMASGADILLFFCFLGQFERVQKRLKCKRVLLDQPSKLTAGLYKPGMYFPYLRIPQGEFRSALRQTGHHLAQSCSQCSRQGGDASSSGNGRIGGHTPYEFIDPSARRTELQTGGFPKSDFG